MGKYSPILELRTLRYPVKQLVENFDDELLCPIKMNMYR
jgi:hypothetical protein